MFAPPHQRAIFIQKKKKKILTEGYKFSKYSYILKIK
jgi:hypothetical protein